MEGERYSVPVSQMNVLGDACFYAMVFTLKNFFFFPTPPPFCVTKGSDPLKRTTQGDNLKKSNASFRERLLRADTQFRKKFWIIIACPTDKVPYNNMQMSSCWVVIMGFKQKCLVLYLNSLSYCLKKKEVPSGFWRRIRPDWNGKPEILSGR